MDCLLILCLKDLLPLNPLKSGRKKLLKEINMPPIISIVGKSNSGKTTLLEKLIPALKNRGLRVGVIKHSSHAIIIDHEGKDSWRHKQAGADCVGVLSATNLALFKDRLKHLSLEEVVRQSFSDTDIVLTEGFKKEIFPKIEVFRQEQHASPLCINEKTLIAFVSDSNINLEVPCFGLDDIEQIADLLERRYHESGTN